jgi:hypothetical protein
MRTDVATIIERMRATFIPEGSAGLWRVERLQITPVTCDMIKRVEKREAVPGPLCLLRRYTDSTLYTGGEVVMDDSPHELKKHLNFVLRARGRVLVTGLGLGCVVRGLLARPAVQHVDVVERSQDVIDLVGPYMPASRRLAIHHADAFEFLRNPASDWDCAWHDIWTDTDAGEPSLQLAHALLQLQLHGRVRWQGAWAFPRHFRRAYRSAVEHKEAFQ